ncbi:MAG: sugar-binding protein [Bacteroidota bacterium]|nr:sugar-binding protein [Bacteroidota bacterium]
MRRIQFLLFAITCATVVAFGQTTIDNFERARPDTLYATSFESPTTITLSQDAADKIEGTSSLVMWNVLAAHIHSYGTYSQVGWTSPTATLNWGTSESLSVWIKVTKAPKIPEFMSFRLQVSDNIGGVRETWVYQHNTILDAANGWVNLHIPLVERISDGTTAPDSTGFVISPANWNFSTNDKHFNADRIGSWYFTMLPTSQADDSIEVKFDKFEQFGAKPVPFTFFNGMAFDGIVSGDPWAWGSSSVAVELAKGPVVGGTTTNAVKWVQGTNPGWGADSGYTGWGVSLTPINMSGAWKKDSLKFKLKAAAEATTDQDSIRVQIEGGGGKTGIVFDLIADDTWHSYAFPLKNLVYQDNTGHMDSSKVNVLGFMAQKSGKVGRTIYVTDIWTGTPTFDVIPPLPPTGVDALGGTFTNLVLWNDLDEPGAKYNVYYSDKKFTKIDSTVDDVPPYNDPAGIGSKSHVLRSPVTDQNVSYYYGVAAKDAAGNIGLPGVSASAVTTKAKGVPVISDTPPTNFVADGAIGAGEWGSIAPIRLNAFGLNAPAHVATNTAIKDSLDLNVKVYMAVDANNLYIAYDVIDDTVSVDTLSGQTYMQDSPDLNIGLYDWRGPHHAGYSRGTKPDYMLRFSKNRLNDDHSGKILMYPGPNYIWKAKTLSSGYVVEAKIPFTTFAAISSGDQVFIPKKGMRIPIDFSINDRDAGTGRDGILAYSYLNQDNSWQNMYNWTHTWIGNAWTTGVQQDATVAESFELSQNYPNPFNPTTSIRYSLPHAGFVTLKVYDLLGREVMNVVNQHQSEGSYTVSLDASTLATGMYMYKLESGSFTSVKKMLLLK